MRTKHFRLCRITTNMKRHMLRKVTTSLTLGALAAALAISTSAPAFAGKPHQSRPGGHHEQTQEHEVSAVGKRNGGKSKTVKKTFTNAASIAIPVEDPADPFFGPADPYSSSIAVSGFKKAKLTDLNLTLRDFSHGFPGDVQLLLVAPGGRNAVIMGDVSENVDSDVSNITLTLDDEAATLLPEDEPLTGGSFRPLDGLGPGISGSSLTEFPAPAPEPSGNNALATFDGLNPNGEWQLFILDDTLGDVGRLADGWALEITAKSKVKNKGNGKKKR